MDERVVNRGRGEIEVDHTPELVESPSPLERLDASVNLLNRLADRLDNFDLTLGEEAFKRLIEQTLDEARSQSSPESLDNLTRIEAINERIGIVINENPGPLPQEVYDLDKQRSALLVDPETYFLYNLNRSQPGFVEKNKKIFEYYKNRDVLYRDLEHISSTKVPLNLPSVDTFRSYEIQFSAIEATVLLPPGDFNTIYDKGARGVHFENSPISLVKDYENKKHVAETVGHERLHGLTELAMHIESQTLLASISVMTELQGQDAKKTPREYSERLIGYLQTELVSNLDYYADTELENYRQDPNNLFPFSLARPSSEWNMASDVVHRLSAIEGPNSDLTKQVGEEFMRQCAQVTKELKRAVLVSRAIGSDAERDLHTLVVMLQPHQYKNIMRYLRFKYGERYQTAAASYDSIVNLKKGFRRIRDISYVSETENILTELLARAGNLSDADKTYFKEQLNDVEKSLPYLRDWDAKVKEESVTNLISAIRKEIA